MSVETIRHEPENKTLHSYNHFLRSRSRRPCVTKVLVRPSCSTNLFLKFFFFLVVEQPPFPHPRQPVNCFLQEKVDQGVTDEVLLLLYRYYFYCTVLIPKQEIKALVFWNPGTVPQTPRPETTYKSYFSILTGRASNSAPWKMATQ